MRCIVLEAGGQREVQVYPIKQEVGQMSGVEMAGDHERRREGAAVGGA